MSRSLRADTTVLATLAVVASVTAYVFFRETGTVIGYKDAASHLFVGRRIVVGEQTGFGQLGGIWLPLPHLLAATLAWNDTLYLSGLAGSIFSMAAYVGTVVGLYAVVRAATGDRLAAWAAAGVFGLSANALYLQSTPMGEPLMYLGIVWAVYAVLRWYQTDRPRWLFAGAMVCALLVFVRYEAWVFSAALWVVVVHVCIAKGHRFLSGDQAGQAYALVFGTYMAGAVGLWLLWDLMIFGDGLAWLRGAYSSIDQLSDIQLKQVGDVRISLLTYWYGVRDTVGVPVLAAGVVGLLLMAWRERVSPLFTLFLVTVVPGAFLAYGLYSGAQPMQVDEVDGSLYNLRMALVMLLPCALFIGYAVSTLPRVGAWTPGALRGVALALVVVVAGSGLVRASATGGDSVATSREATVAYDAFAEQHQVATFVADHTTGRVLVESFGNEWIVFPIQRRVIYEGSQDQWKQGLTRPDGPKADIDVVVMRTTPGNPDSVAQHLYDSPAMRDYGVVLETNDFMVWERGVANDDSDDQQPGGR